MEPAHSFNTWNYIPRTSQLCKPLAAILKDSGALSMLEYFIQYMDEQDALHLLQFWFAVESFKIAAPSPKHATDYTRQLNSPTGDKQCDIAHVETNITRHMTHETVSIKEEPKLECTVDTTAPYPTLNNDTVSKSEEGTRYCNIEGRKDMWSRSANSDTIDGQMEQPAVNSDVAAPTGGIHVHQRLLKQLSLSKEVCRCLFTSIQCVF